MRRDLVLMLVLALVVGSILVILLDEPGYTDAYYYFNAGQRLAQGDGLTDPYVWIYLNPPDKIPAPSHTYWMPLASMVSAGSMVIFGANFNAAQIPSVLALVGLVVMGGWLGYTLGGTRRYSWMTGLIVLFGGFFFPFWANTDTFALYGLVGAGALIAMGLGRQKNDWRWFAVSGALSGLAHLTRADGVLLLVVALLLTLWPHPSWKSTTSALIAYFIVMLAWFIRNLGVIDAPIPSGGINTAFLRGYNELFAYPVDWSLANFMGWGTQNILESRWNALLSNFGTWLAVETWVLIGPFALAALWKRRKNPLLTGFWVYALGLHLAMTFIFAYPGYRGGLFHSSSALVPFWAILGIIGLDDAINWAAQRRKWNPPQARMVFGSAMLVLVILLSGFAWSAQARNREGNPNYDEISAYLPLDAVLMVNDPPAWYFHTGLMSVNLPDAPLNRLPEIAARYCVTHLVIDQNVTDAFLPLIDKGETPPPFLEQIAYLDRNTKGTGDDVRIYRFVEETTPNASPCNSTGNPPS
ncbi:MAG: glycosyltransferase family 39 protein [Chloroflexi bacterium]|nr:glycosyltransferase family 39 protein [Chloroflexota bacterium]